MKYFIARYRVSQDALDVLFGALKKAEHEGIEFLGCVEDAAPQPVRATRKAVNRNGSESWPKAAEYFEEVAAFMAPHSAYDRTKLVKNLQIRNRFKFKGQLMGEPSKHQLITKLIEIGKLVIEDGMVKLSAQTLPQESKNV